MDLYIHYTALPEGLALEDVVDQLNVALDDGGVVNGGFSKEVGGRIDLELQDENMNPKYAQMSVKSYLQKANFPKDTAIEFAGMEIGIYL